MKLSQLTAKPSLIEVSIDDEDVVKEYGEPITFHMYDRQPIEVFMKLANSDQSNPATMIDIVRHLLLDESGKPVLTDDTMLPTNILIKAMSKVTEKLGK